MENKSSISHWIKLRRSTFTGGLKAGGKIADTVIIKLMENACWAPSHGLVQPWYFKVFADRGVETFFEVQREIYKEITAPEKFNQEKYDRYTEKKNQVSHIIVILMKRDPKQRFPVQEDLVSAACALQNIYLSMAEFGIAGYLSTGELCYSEPMRKYLALNEEDACLGFFILGLPNEELKILERKRIDITLKSDWTRE